MTGNIRVFKKIKIILR